MVICDVAVELKLFNCLDMQMYRLKKHNISKVPKASNKTLGMAFEIIILVVLTYLFFDFLMFANGQFVYYTNYISTVFKEKCESFINSSVEPKFAKLESNIQNVSVNLDEINKKVSHGDSDSSLGYSYFDFKSASDMNPYFFPKPDNSVLLKPTALDCSGGCGVGVKTKVKIAFPSEPIVHTVHTPFQKFQPTSPQPPPSSSSPPPPPSSSSPPPPPSSPSSSPPSSPASLSNLSNPSHSPRPYAFVPTIQCNDDDDRENESNKSNYDEGEDEVEGESDDGDNAAEPVELESYGSNDNSHDILI